MLDVLILLKRVTDYLRTFVVMSSLVVILANMLSQSADYSSYFKWLFFSLSGLLILVGIAIVCLTVDYKHYLKTSRLVNVSLSFLAIGFLLWQQQLIPNPYGYGFVMLVSYGLSRLYQRYFKTLMVSIVVPEKVSNDVTFVKGDIARTEELLTSHMKGMVKPKYSGRVEPEVLYVAKNGSNHLMDFVVGFVRRGTRPIILFEVVTSINLEG